MSLEKKIKKVVKKVVKDAKSEGTTTTRIVRAEVTLKKREPYERNPPKYEVNIDIRRVA